MEVQVIDFIDSNTFFKIQDNVALLSIIKSLIRSYNYSRLVLLVKNGKYKISQLKGRYIFVGIMVLGGYFLRLLVKKSGIYRLFYEASLKWNLVNECKDQHSLKSLVEK